MRGYRVAFFITLAAALLLAGALTVVALRPHALDDIIERVKAKGTTEAPPVRPETAAIPELVPVTLTPERMQRIGVKTGTAEYKQVHDEIRTTGTVEVDETRLSEVQVRFSGWVQKVFVDATFQPVRVGQPLLTIYSPDLVTTENEYLLAKQNRDLLARSTVPGVASGSVSLLSSALERLKQWQIPDRELAELEESGKVKRELEVDSPASGLIVERNALPNMYVQPGTKLYSVADLSSVWVYAQLFQNDLGRVAVGNAAEITVDS